LFTCPGFGAVFEEAKKALSIPVLKPDEAMGDEALSAGPCIGRLATFWFIALRRFGVLGKKRPEVASSSGFQLHCHNDSEVAHSSSG
jgi:hypothetical protein